MPQLDGAAWRDPIPVLQDRHDSGELFQWYMLLINPDVEFETLFNINPGSVLVIANSNCDSLQGGVLCGSVNEGQKIVSFQTSIKHGEREASILQKEMLKTSPDIHFVEDVHVDG